MSFSIAPTQALPRFSGLVYKTELTDGRQLPKVSAYVADFASFPADSKYPREDGTVVFESPSGKMQVMDDDNASVAKLTTTLRDAKLFGTDRLPLPAGTHKLIADVWTDIKALFASGQLPRTCDATGETYFETLFESQYQRGSQPAEQLLTSALGYDYDVTLPCFDTRNKRHVQIMPTPVVAAIEPEAVPPPTESTE